MWGGHSWLPPAFSRRSGRHARSASRLKAAAGKTARPTKAQSRRVIEHSRTLSRDPKHLLPKTSCNPAQQLLLFVA
jgi:hypothetical protein